MKRLDRLTSILIQLQSKKIVRAQELADKYDVSKRTIYRDVMSLQEAGVPIGSQEGVGYFLVDGYHLPPVMFTEDEANSLVMAQKLAAELSDETVKKEIDSAVDKIKAVLPSRQKDQLSNLDKNVKIQNAYKVESENPVLVLLQQSLAQKRIVSFDYYSNYNGQKSSREVEPIGLVHYADAWHLMAWCKMREDYRDFRTDRMTKVNVSDEGYDRNAHPGLDDYLNDIQQRFVLHDCAVFFSERIIRFTEKDRFKHGFLSEEKKSDGYVLKFLSPSIDYFARWLIMFEAEIEIISPPELKAHVEGIVKNLSKKYLP